MDKFIKKFNALGTKITLTVFNNLDQKVFEPSYQLINYFENLFSIYLDNSEVSQINQLAGKKAVSVSSSTFDLIKLSKKVSLNSWGFNVAIGSLVKEWNIGLDNAHVPNNAKVHELLKLTDPNKIVLDPSTNSVLLKQTNMQLDLGGIAKGYIADRLKDLWHAFGVKNGIIDLGGNLLTLGKNPLHSDKRWRIGIQDPWNPRGKELKVIAIPECSAVTSGVYERYYYDGTQTYHHILDPQTGFPLKTELMSVTVFTDQSVWGEIEATRLFFNPQTLIDDIKKDPHFIGAVFIYQNHKIRIIGF